MQIETLCFKDKLYRPLVCSWSVLMVKSIVMPGDISSTFYKIKHKKPFKNY